MNAPTATGLMPNELVIGMMIGRAGLLSAFFTIFVLPGILYLFDGVIKGVIQFPV